MDPSATMIAVHILSGEYVAILAAVIVFFLARRRSLRQTSGTARQPIFARSVVVTVGVLGFVANLLFLLPLTRLPIDLPPGIPYRGSPLEVLPAWAEYAIVPAVGAIAQLLFLVAAARWVRRTRGEARGLDPRSRVWWSFLPRGTVAIAGTLIGLAGVTVVFTGLTSRADSLGRSVLLQIDTPGGYGQNLFPGWYYTVPAIIGMLALVLLAVAALALVSRPPILRDRDDSARRRAAADISVGALGFLSMTLGRLWIFAAVGGVGAARITTDAGSAWIVTSFQAVTPLLGVAGAVLVGAGLAAYALLIVPLRSRSKVPVNEDAP